MECVVTDATGSPIEEVSVLDTWSRLASDPKAVLVDVRTMAEWAFVGVPDLSKLGKPLLRVEWQGFPDNRANAVFVPQLVEQLTRNGIGQDDEILFICRSGGRSLMAARAMAAAGYSRCRNVTHGFEGPLDPERHRGRLEGWKARGLAWSQG
jgi:rhodanese-related sulfurtransferase